MSESNCIDGFWQIAKSFDSEDCAGALFRVMFSAGRGRNPPLIENLIYMFLFEPRYFI
jgi:hypothetical protein